MIKTLMALLMALFAATAFAAADANTASQADLDAVKGIGPSTASKIIDERKNGTFKDWNDLVTRVKGIGSKNAVKLSAAGLTVNGAALTGAPATTAAPAKTATKTPMAAPSTTTTTAAPAATTAPNGASAPLSAADRKAAAKQERDEKKAAKKAAKAASSAAAASAATKK